MRFRPCIDLHGGKVKQIVGSTLDDHAPANLKENFVSELPPAHYARLFRRDGLAGGHVIMLGPGNEEAAVEALAAWPGGFHVGGGITLENARSWLDKGASKVIVTSYVFSGGHLQEERLAAISRHVGKDRLVLDLSCRRGPLGYHIVTDRWQKFTDVVISPATLDHLARYCDEFLVHGADVEGKCLGVEKPLVVLLGEAAPIPTTYAGGIASMEDVKLVRELGRDRLDITVGSALDIFGGTGIRYDELVAFLKPR
ncbi:MAG: phosphoribosylformimino-5-aminoimidazole carboxamide ribotide isomerase [Deltaproteobacteria bacterium]